VRRERAKDYVSRVSLRDTTSVRQSIADALRPHARAVLAVSGGLDSMVLLDAAAGSMSRERLTVATFDHGTGPAATEARRLVEQTTTALGVACVAACADRPLASEAEFRDARWRFLREVARSERGVVCTAHTADDQIETVLMRVLRDAGARGLAGLYATSDIARPLVRLSRRDVSRYARARELAWIEDPSNASTRYLRNRLRRDLLPALRRAHPSIDDELLSLARDAARWRDDVETFVGQHVATRCIGDGAGLDVDVSSLTGYSGDGLSILWPAIVARVGLALDRRGTARLVAVTRQSRVGSRMQLSGGWEVVRSRDAFQLRASGHGQPAEMPLVWSSTLNWGAWVFRPTTGEGYQDGADSWSAWLPADRPLVVRPWQPGDAMADRAGKPARKVKQLLSDGGVTGHERAGWPVVLAGDEIVWIPGIRRGDAATARSGRPGLAFVCEYVNR
jgi:tRNA(Ile)-lysidine synthase